MLSPAQHVREFTAGAGQPTPDTPTPMSEAEVHFIAKMIVDETMELWATTTPSDEAVQAMVDIVQGAKPIEKETYPDGQLGVVHQCAAQADALVVTLEPNADVDVDRFKQVVADHLDRFAFKEAPLPFDWK